MSEPQPKPKLQAPSVSDAPTLAALVDEYHVHHTRVKSLATTTIINYTARLRTFARSQPEGAKVDTFTLDNVRRYFESKQAVVPKSMPMCYSALCSFGEWLVDNKHLDTNPVRLHKPYRDKSVIRDAVAPEVITRVLAACDNLDMPLPRRLQAKAVMYTLVFSGLRLSEMLSLKIRHVDLQIGRLIVHEGKGGKSRVVFVAPELIGVLQECLAQRPLAAPTEPVFVRMYTNAQAYTKPLSKEAVYRLRDRVLALVEWEGKPITPHQFRHSFASRMYKNGANIAAIRDLLGHSNIATTSRYIHSNAEELQEAARLASLPLPAPQTNPASVPPSVAKPKGKPEPKPESEPKPKAEKDSKDAPAGKRPATWRKPPPEPKKKPPRYQRENLRRPKEGE